jgi:hypothetical protein
MIVFPASFRCREKNTALLDHCLLGTARDPYIVIEGKRLVSLIVQVLVLANLSFKSG